MKTFFLLIITLCVFCLTVSTANAWSLFDNDEDLVKIIEGEKVMPSTSYDVVYGVMEKGNLYITKIFSLISKAIFPVFYWFYVLMISFMIISYMLNGNISLSKGVMTGMLIVFFAGEMLHENGLFEWFYYPVMDMVIGLTGLILQVGIENAPAGTNGLDSLKLGFHQMDASFDMVNAAAGKVIKALDWDYFGMLNMAGIKIAAILLDISYSVLKTSFIIMFITGLMAAHVMLAAMPFALMLAPFEQTRYISKNIVRSFFTYALIPPFAAAALGFTLIVIADVVTWAEKLSSKPILTYELVMEEFYFAIVYAIFSFFLVIKASQFASQVVTGGGSAFGNMFAPTLTLATVAAKKGAMGYAGGKAGGKIATSYVKGKIGGRK